MKKNWAIRKDAEAVSPVIATILMVAITVVLAAVLYVMVLGFGGGGTQTPTMQVTKSSTSTGLRFTVAGITKDTQWGDMKILLQNGTTTASWPLTTAQLTGGAGKTYTAAAQSSGTAQTVVLAVVDLVGNGYINGGDYITLTPNNAFLASSSLTLTLIYVPTGSEMTHVTFTG
jgi:flagellin-like protein